MGNFEALGDAVTGGVIGRAVEPKAVEVALKGASIVHRFPPASVTKLTITLG